jgi:hypothetical protein
MGLLTDIEKARAWKRLHMEQPYMPTNCRPQDKTANAGLVHMRAGLRTGMDDPDTEAIPGMKEILGQNRIVCKWIDRKILITRTEAERVLYDRS